MSGYDTLLEWASEAGSGSWRLWRDSCETLSLEPTVAMQNLAALGHVEMDWSADRFCCAPPTAAFLLRSSGCVLLTGARPRGLLDRLREADGALAEFDYFVHDPVEQHQGPATVLIEVELDDLDELCRAADLTMTFDPSGRLAAALPVATLSAVASRESVPPREEVPRRRFDPRTLTLRPDSGTGAEQGLWWYDGYRRAEAWIATGADWWYVPTREFAPYLAFPERPLLRHCERRRQLFVYERAPLPPLQARVATLASGRLPRRSSMTGPSAWAYENIPFSLAQELAASLATPLERL